MKNTRREFLQTASMIISAASSPASAAKLLMESPLGNGAAAGPNALLMRIAHTLFKINETTETGIFDLDIPESPALASGVIQEYIRERFENVKVFCDLVETKNKLLSGRGDIQQVIADYQSAQRDLLAKARKAIDKLEDETGYKEQILLELDRLRNSAHISYSDAQEYMIAAGHPLVSEHFKLSQQAQKHMTRLLGWSEDYDGMGGELLDSCLSLAAPDATLGFKLMSAEQFHLPQALAHMRYTLKGELMDKSLREGRKPILSEPQLESWLDTFQTQYFPHVPLHNVKAREEQIWRKQEQIIEWELEEHKKQEREKALREQRHVNDDRLYMDLRHIDAARKTNWEERMAVLKESQKSRTKE